MRGFGPALAFMAMLLLAFATRFPSAAPRPDLLASTTLPASTERQPGPRPLALLQGDLLSRLSQADEAWKPRTEPLPGGGTRYIYRRRSGDPPLTVAQLRVLVANPPRFELERQSIISLLGVLDQLGISVSLSQPVKRGAAGEWEASRRSLRIRPDVPNQGTLEFARVLNHEAIHVAQSCAAGGLSRNPRPIGISLQLQSGSLMAAARSSTVDGDGPEGLSRDFRQLQDPIYANASPTTRQAEREAYALQNRLGTGETLVRQFCLERRR